MLKQTRNVEFECILKKYRIVYEVCIFKAIAGDELVLTGHSPRKRVSGKDY